MTGRAKRAALGVVLAGALLVSGSPAVGQAQPLDDQAEWRVRQEIVDHALGQVGRREGSGNYWSDQVAFDINGDGLADSPYRPNDLVDRIAWSQPMSKLLMGSPAVQLIRWSQSRFPGLMPGGVIDSHPLMSPAQTGLEATQGDSSDVQ